ncbi:MULTISPECIES: hypothetical protein [Xanthomonas]|uniref:hypothetical protein n=1 Tax=Xanthomonas TaxID=338 RepID=UPI001ADA2F96|nr:MULTISPECIES: hypothetical protein [unclassified Xanthomonas]MBO9873479.1 hypothetical protein [Xanthomonas sp. D-93]WNH45263.1 hypothetical protein PG878_01955 [Xanthomonas sp. A6251]
MGALFWIKRLLVSLVAASSVLSAVQYLKGSPLSEAAQFGATWGAVFSVLFAGIGYVRYRRNPSCMLPRSRD